MKMAVRTAIGLAALLIGTMANATELKKSFDVTFDDIKGDAYVLIPSSKITRYANFDYPNMKAYMKLYAPNVELKLLNAEDQVSQQVSQFDAALANNAVGIILISVDQNQSGGMLMKGDDQKVPVVTFAADVGKGPARYHVTVPYEQIGRDQGKYFLDNLPDAKPVKLALMLGDPKFAFYTQQMKGLNDVLKPAIEAGKVEIVCSGDALLWNPANAQTNMEQCLSKTDNDVNAVYLMNDDIGNGVLAALVPQGLEGKAVLYGGYDATLQAIQRIATGWQAGTMSPPYRQMDEKAIVLLLSAIAGKEPPAGIINGRFDNGYVEGGVPTSYTDNVFINLDNLNETVIEPGIWTVSDICTGIAASSEYCQNNKK